MQLTSLRATKGFTLLEVLIAMTITTFGMLGIASLHLVSLENTNGAYLRSQAVAISDDLIERLRSNPKLLEYARNNDVNSTTSYTETASCYTTAGCTPELLATSELAKWATSLSRLGDTSTRSTSGSPPAVHVTLIHQANKLFELKITWKNKQWQQGTTAAPAATRKQAASNYEFLVAIN